MRKIFVALAITLGLAFLAPPTANAAVDKPLKCVASDPDYVVVNSANESVAITDNPITYGNHFGCYTNIVVTAGDTISFTYTGTCGGGVPRVFVRFAGGASENTIDSDPTCLGSTAGSVTYTLINSGKIKSFAFINDRGDSGTVTYSNLTIGGTVVNF